jgi:hypothetical protein
MSSFKTVLVMAVATLLLADVAPAQKKTKSADADYIAQALSAAPKAVAKEAAVVRMETDGKMTTLRDGKNGFTCMVLKGEKMCADANSMEFFGAYMKHQPPPDKLGLVYMLSGHDAGASNTDPFATGKTADNHWVITGPHVMILGSASKSFGLSKSPEADPSKPYMMWADTPYEHAMIPVTSAAGAAKSATPKTEAKK